MNACTNETQNLEAKRGNEHRDNQEFVRRGICSRHTTSKSQLAVGISTRSVQASLGLVDLRVVQRQSSSPRGQTSFKEDKLLDKTDFYGFGWNLTLKQVHGCAPRWVAQFLEQVSISNSVGLNMSSGAGAWATFSRLAARSEI